MRRLRHQWIPFPSHVSHRPALDTETQVLVFSASIPYFVLAVHARAQSCSNGVAQTVPAYLLPTVKGILSACPTSAAARTASPTPGAGCFLQATPCQGRTGGVGRGRGALP